MLVSRLIVSGMMRGLPSAKGAVLPPRVHPELAMTQADDSERLLTREELAAYWRVSPKTVSRINKKDLPVVRIGKQVRYRPSDVSAYERRNC